MSRPRLLFLFALSSTWLFGATPAFAHHEAIFGPQSSAVLSATTFASAQVFSRETGPAPDRVRSTTMVLSGGVQPFKKPLSVAMVLPVSFSSQPGLAGAKSGLEDLLISVRYRADTQRITDALRLDESSFMAVGGVELPTGTFDHDFGRGAPGAIAAGLFSVERRPISLIGYGYYHHTSAYRGSRENGNLFFGTGAAWTPIDNLQTGRLLSVQVGVSHERTFAREERGLPVSASGGTGVFLHQGLVWGASEHLQAFTLLSLPVTQRWNSSAEQQRFRLGAGIIVMFGH